MQAATQSTSTQALPTSAEQVMLRVTLQALASTLGPKKSRKFLAAIGDAFTREEAFANVRPINAGPEGAANTEARHAAMAWYRQALPSLIASLD